MLASLEAQLRICMIKNSDVQHTLGSNLGFWRTVTLDNAVYANDAGLVRSLCFNPPFQLLFQLRLAAAFEG